MGLGCMNVSWPQGAATEPGERRDAAIAGIHAGLDAGVRLLDTADIYAPSWDSVGHNELFVAEALATWDAPADVKDSVVVATKGGITRSEGEIWGRNGSRDYFLAAAEASRERLGVDRIDLWQHHRLDPALPFEDQVDNLAHLKERGIVAHVGVSNYSAEQLTRALSMLGGPAEGGVVSIQNEFSPLYRHDLDVLDVCEQWGVAFLPWSPLGGSRGIRQVEANQALTNVAAGRGVSPALVALAWVIEASPVIIAIPGATRVDTIRECAGVLEFELTEDERGEISASLSPSAERSHELEPTALFRN